jgi:ubiquinone/menaquinone biosynthesis C-methylase UbiE
MSDVKQDASEAYIKQRYERWRTMAVPFDYKRTKSGRLAEIIRATGGMPDTALELGVGPGGIAAPLSRNGIHVIGMDLSLDALMRAKEYCRQDDVRLVRGSGFTLPFASGSLPLVYASQVLHLFDNPERLALMKEVHRVLQSGGRFVFDMKNVVTHALRYLGSSPERKRRNFPPLRDLHELLAQAGFTQVETLPGLLPGIAATRLPNLGVVRLAAHTVFFIARRP